MEEMYCANGCGKPVIGEATVGIIMDETAEDGFWEQVQLLCADCLKS